MLILYRPRLIAAYMYLYSSHISWERCWHINKRVDVYLSLVVLKLFYEKFQFPFSMYSLSSDNAFGFVILLQTNFLYKKRDRLSIRSEFTWLSFKQSVAKSKQIFNMKVRVNYIRRSEVFSRLKISAKNIIF